MHPRYNLTNGASPRSPLSAAPGVYTCYSTTYLEDDACRRHRHSGPHSRHNNPLVLGCLLVRLPLFHRHCRLHSIHSILARSATAALAATNARTATLTPRHAATGQPNQFPLRKPNSTRFVRFVYKI